VADGETGLLVAERDEHALVAALDRLLADRELWTRFSVAGRVRVRERFDLRTQTRRLEQIYDSAIAGARPS
jgi:glycosyltransferase involved in cell wall biosynthesis